jgi:hypothetical protein
MTRRSRVAARDHRERGVGDGAGFTGGAPQFHAGTVGGGTNAALTAERGRRRPWRRFSGTSGLLTARLSKRSRAARSPRAPGHADRAERDGAEANEREPQANQRERARRPAARHQAQATAVVWRRLRWARQPVGRSNGPGLTRRAPTWRRATQVKRRNDGDGGLDARLLSRGPLHRAGRRPARTHFTGPQRLRSEGRKQGE